MIYELCIIKQELDLNTNEPGGIVIITIIKISPINSSSAPFPFRGQWFIWPI